MGACSTVWSNEDVRPSVTSNDAVFPLVIGGLLLAFLVFQRAIQSRHPASAH